MHCNPVTSKHLLSKRAVLRQIPISGATMWRTIAAGDFPKPIRLAKRRVAWVASEIDDWLAERMEERGNTKLTDPSSSSQSQKKGGAK
jgi:prophage regulatory protein